MRKIYFLIILAVAFCQTIACAEYLPGIERFKRGERVLIMAPHPDDETIACAGVIQEALKKGAQVRVMYLTNGEHNELAFIVYKKELILSSGKFIEMGLVRYLEAVKAMKTLGLSEDKLIFLGYPDFGTFDIIKGYWQPDKPFWDLLTRISRVPYKNALSYNAPYVGGSILDDIKRVLLDYKPDVIFVSHPADVNVDHKTLYLFLRVALSDLQKELPRPTVYPYLVHHVGWPSPRHLHPQLKLRPPQELVGTGVAWWQFKLTPQQLKRKHYALLSYRSQTQSAAFYLLSFVRQNELFGDFTPIHPVVPAKMPATTTAPAVINFSHISDWQLFSAWVKSLFNFGTVIKKVLVKLPPAQSVFSGNNSLVSYSVEGDSLVVAIQKTKESAKHRLATWVYLLGYSHNIPFANMPKLYIVTRYNWFRIFDGRRLIEPDGVSVTISNRTIALKVPLKELGRPDFILGSIKAYTGTLPLYRSGFRMIDITGRYKDARIKTGQGQ